MQVGEADIGGEWKVRILERQDDGYYEPLDLGIARCKIMTAVTKGASEQKGRLRVATKYINVARQF